MGRGKLAEPVEDALPLRMIQGRDAGDGGGTLDDLSRAERLGRLDVPLGEGTELRRSLERGAPLPVLMVRTIGIHRVDEGIERRDPRDPPIAHVPDQPQPAAGGKDPVEFGQRPVPVEPVECLRDGDGMRRAVAERHVLRGAREWHGARHVLREPLAHLGERLDRDERGAGRHKRASELSGARADVEDDRARPDSKRADEDVDPFGRVLRAHALIQGGRRPEASRDVIVQRLLRHRFIVSMVTAPQVLVIGPLAYDDVRTPHAHRSRLLGGSAAYAGIAAAKHAPTMLVSVCGSDLRDDDLGVLRAAEIDLGGLVRRDGRTLRWSGTYTDDFTRSDVENTDLGAVAGWRPQVPDAARDAPYIFLTNTQPVIQAAALDQLRPRVTLLDTMDEWILDHRSELERVIARVQVVSVNEHELRLISGENDIARGALAVLARGPRAILVKGGARGAAIFSAHGAFTVPAHPAKTVDPTGAGDALGGAFIGRLARAGIPGEAGHRDALVAGVAAASFAVESFGVEALARAGRAALEARAQALAGRSGTGTGVRL